MRLQVLSLIVGGGRCSEAAAICLPSPGQHSNKALLDDQRKIGPFFMKGSLSVVIALIIEVTLQRWIH